MNKNQIRILLSLFFVFICVTSFAQTIKYVAYFPVPYLTHKTINAQTVYFAGKENGLQDKFSTTDLYTVEVKGTLTANKVNSRKDMELRDSSNTTTPISTILSIGTEDGSVTGNQRGKFIVDKAGGILNISAIESSQINKLQADDALNIKAVYWKDDVSGNPLCTNINIVEVARPIFKKQAASCANGIEPCSGVDKCHDVFPGTAHNLCWAPLRIKGTYDYQYYLIAYDGNTCPGYGDE